MKIKKARNSNKNITMRIKKIVLCSGLILISSLGLTGCRENKNKSADTIKEEIYQSDDLGYSVGFIKNGNQYIPFYQDKSGSNNEFYYLYSGEYIGHLSTISVNDVVCYTIENKNQVLYTVPQLFFFKNIYPNENYDIEFISQFDVNVYQMMEEESLKTMEFFKDVLNIYLIKSLETGEVTTFIGYPVSKTQFFNFETYKVEEYKDYNVDILLNGTNLEKDFYFYEDILGTKEQIQEEEMGMNL